MLAFAAHIHTLLLPATSYNSTLSMYNYAPCALCVRVAQTKYNLHNSTLSMYN